MTDQQAAAAAGPVEKPETGSEVHNVIVVGSGPAGYTAAIYLARAELKPTMFAGEKWGGQLMLTTEVENYPGFEKGILGPDLMAIFRKQAERFGTQIQDKNVTKVDFSANPLKIWQDEIEYQAHAVVITTGAESRLLGVPGESEFLGKGVSTCAVCDAPFYKGKAQTFVVGGGDAAMEEAMALSKYAQKVTVIHRREELKASKIMQRRVKEAKNVDIMWNSELTEVKGTDSAEKIVVKNKKTGETKELAMDGIFIAIGHKPMTEVFKDQLELDEKGYIITRLGLEKRSLELAGKHIDENGLVRYPTMTSREGVFAAGDVVDFRYRQAVTAAGLGTMAALDTEKWLEQEKNIEVGGTVQY